MARFAHETVVEFRTVEHRRTGLDNTVFTDDIGTYPDTRLGRTVQRRLIQSAGTAYFAVIADMAVLISRVY